MLTHFYVIILCFIFTLLFKSFSFFPALYWAETLFLLTVYYLELHICFSILLRVILTFAKYLSKSKVNMYLYYSQVQYKFLNCFKSICSSCLKTSEFSHYCGNYYFQQLTLIYSHAIMLLTVASDILPLPLIPFLSSCNSLW